MTSTFHCPVCGLTRHNRPATYRHRCPGPKASDYSKHRDSVNPPPKLKKKVKAVSMLPIVSPVASESKPKRRPRKPKPGRELESIIPKFFATGGCGCQSYARQMDKWGIEGCEERFDEIVDHLCEKAKESPLLVAFTPAHRLVARSWLRKAIDNAKAAAE